MKPNVLLVGAAILCSACSLSPIISTDIVSYNKAVSDSNNRMMVLNILRARDHVPLSFSSVQLVHGSLQAAGSTNLGFPFGNMPLKVNDSLGIGLSAQVAPTFDVRNISSASSSHDGEGKCGSLRRVERGKGRTPDSCRRRPPFNLITMSVSRQGSGVSVSLAFGTLLLPIWAHQSETMFAAG